MTNYLEEVNITEDGSVVKKVITKAEEDAPFPHDKEIVTVKVENRLEMCNMMEPDGIIWHQGEFKIKINHDKMYCEGFYMGLK